MFFMNGIGTQIIAFPSFKSINLVSLNQVSKAREESSFFMLERKIFPY
jgi:hypothetical protein